MYCEKKPGGQIHRVVLAKVSQESGWSAMIGNNIMPDQKRIQDTF